jgi:methyl-accepting chemotaxis protein
MDLDSAIQKHAEWKMKFRAAISKQETMDVATISKDNCCDLGKWLHGEGRTQHGSLGTFSPVVSSHAAFHNEAGKVAVAINAKRYADAEKMLDGGTPYAAASNTVAGAIMKLKKEANL